MRVDRKKIIGLLSSLEGSFEIGGNKFIVQICLIVKLTTDLSYLNASR